MKGVFGLHGASDLLKKLEWEFEKLNAEPTNPYIAYNFFVTAWHLLEWKYPDPNGTSERKRIKNEQPILQICEHLAVGAKHFIPGNKELNAVLDSEKSSCWNTEAWAPNVWNWDIWASWLVVELEGEARKKYGSHIKVEELAHHVMEYWRPIFDPDFQ